MTYEEMLLRLREDVGIVRYGVDGNPVDPSGVTKDEADAARARLAALPAAELVEALLEAKRYMVAKGAKELPDCEDKKCRNEMCVVNRALDRCATALEATP